ncbi:hypothetical protein WBG99_21250 [Streptomyces sp. TG1A-60]|uniref:hypothetical protein n=1 Tax=Streptomyces sp. TG1A-60 TaxID=3129111 RepID=UPI0030D61E9F
MNRSGIRRSRTRATALAALVLPLALITACGGSGSEGDAGEESASAQATQSAESGGAAKPLTAAELGKASLAEGDVEGYGIKEPGAGDVAAQDDVSADDEACMPVAQAVAGVTPGEPPASTNRQAIAEPDKSAVAEDADPEEVLEAAFDVSTTMVVLASYKSPEVAEAALKSVSDAVTTCAGGFQGTALGEKQKVTKVTEDTAPEAGDEAVAFSAMASVDGGEGPMKVVVFRTGSTLAQFTSVNLASLTSGKDFDFPADLVTAQADKLA